MASKLIYLTLIVLFALLSLNSCFLKTESLSKRTSALGEESEEVAEADNDVNFLQTLTKENGEEEEENDPSVLLQREEDVAEAEKIVEGGETVEAVEEAAEGVANIAKASRVQEEDD